MRTSHRRVPAMLLPLALLGLVAHGVVAQESEAVSDRDGAAQGRVVTGDRTIEEGEVVDEIVVVRGDLRIRGEVRGDAVVIDGDLILEEGALVGGDVAVTGGELVNQGGRVRGEMRSIEGNDLDIAGEVDRALSEADIAVGEARSALPPTPPTAPRPPRVREEGSGFGPVRRGFAGIVSTVAMGLVLAGIGATLVFYGRPYLETVSDTVRISGIRSGATGLAASFLAFPAFVVLLVALAVSIIGIPFLLIAIPLYPLALFAGAVFGLLGVAHAIGERTAEQSRDGLDFRYRNSYAYLFTGLGMMLTPLLAAHLISMTGFLGFIGTLLQIATWLAIWVASTVGIGAVILSRAGTRRTFASTPTEPVLDTDDLFVDEPIRRDHA
ncbi:MAG: hypothetical protein GEU90_06460 [Gemmatimonas sp.]|nr:hypothetical protein [Gemmatimonas sp.]